MRFITNSMKRERADAGRVNPIKQIKTRVKSGNVKQNRKTSHMYNNKRWRELRLEILNLTPLCVHCGEAATTVDHILPHKGDWKLFLDHKNLQSLCKKCHDAKTRAERKAPRMGMTGRLKPFIRHKSARR